MIKKVNQNVKCMYVIGLCRNLRWEKKQMQTNLYRLCSSIWGKNNLEKHQFSTNSRYNWSYWVLIETNALLEL